MRFDRFTDVAWFLLRVVVGIMFMQAGGMKILDWFGGIPAEFGGHPAMWSQTWIGGMLELICGALIILGLFTRVAAFIASGEMAVAFWQFHFKQETPWPIQTQSELSVAYCFLFLFMAAYGAGKWSLDAKLFKKRG
ncbi:MAG: DoxX family protein [Fimbriimonadaceae bacterium]